jgi:hypothetical protein
MAPLLPLLFISFLAVTTSGATTPPPASDAIRLDETRLLHQAVRPIDLSNNLRIFDPRAGEWLRTESSDPPAGRVLVVYLWQRAQGATTTPVATLPGELPWLRELARRVEAYHGGDVRFLFVAEGLSAAELTAALPRPQGAPPERAPSLPFFLDSESGIAETLRQALPGSELPLPVTLLLDDQYVVRQAFIGSLASRRSELVSAISDLLYQLRANRGHRP